jgi:hypothetical protein
MAYGYIFYSAIFQQARSWAYAVHQKRVPVVCTVPHVATGAVLIPKQIRRGACGLYLMVLSS